MLVDLRTLEPGAEIRTQVCVVGAGAAGIPLALELAARSIDVVLLEAGGLAYEEATQELYNGPIVGHANTDIASSRLRQFGGTTGHWTGLCAPLDAIDFEARADVPQSGWPIGRADVDPFYRQAQTYLELGPFQYGFEAWRAKMSAPSLPLDPALVSHAVYQQSPPTRFADTYADAIGKAQNIRCLLHANLTDIVLGDDGYAVQMVVAQTLEGRRVSVRAQRFVLACGGVENARILLNCRRQRPNGIGNERDLVGRYFNDHLNTETSAIVFGDESVDLDLYGEPEIEGTRLKVGFKLPEEVVRREGLLNNTAFLVPERADATFDDHFRNHGWVSFSTIAKAFSQGRAPERFAENFCNAVEDADTIAVGLTRHALRRFVPPGKVLAATLRQDAECAPNPDSRVLLTGERDRFGWQRAALDWRIADADMRSLRRTHELIGVAVGAAGLGRMRLGIAAEAPSLETVYTGYHHMGTTRMHADPAQGVVDANCRLHEVENLYVAGSSVFTTGGTANPTLTIVALALRLADHLAHQNLARAGGSS